jgi:redox-sensitive bicupin YhaK (pirin superfamily)
MLAHQLQQPVREVIYRTQGSAGGPITRLMSPSDLGELIKPFVFLDRFNFDGQDAPMSMEHGWHPHSGIATVTVLLEGSTRFRPEASSGCEPETAFGIRALKVRGA